MYIYPVEVTFKPETKRVPLSITILSGKKMLEFCDAFKEIFPDYSKMKLLSPPSELTQVIIKEKK